MKKFTIKANKYVDRDVTGYYNCDYVGYQKQGNPDFINRLKNMSKQYTISLSMLSFISSSKLKAFDIAFALESLLEKSK